MAKKIWYSSERSTFTGRSERQIDGWFVKLRNDAQFPIMFLVSGFTVQMEKGSSAIARKIALRLISDNVANPGEEISLKFEAPAEVLEVLRGATLKLHLGHGIGGWNYCELTLA
jgi:hypothetical protein